MKKTNIFTYDAPARASVGALFVAALGGGELSQGRLAEGALRQLSDEILLVADYWTSETDSPLEPEIIGRVLRGIAERARVAAEVAERFGDVGRVPARETAETQSEDGDAP